MERRTVTVEIAGQSFRVVTSADESDLQRLAAMVATKLAEVTPRGRSGLAQPNGILLAAIALAHELEEERAKRSLSERRAKEMMAQVLVRIDEALQNAV